MTDWFSKLPRPAARWTRLFVLAALVGAGAGAAAAGVEWALHHGSDLFTGRFAHLGGAGIMQFHWGVLLLPAAGGLVSGVVVYLIFRLPTGHGTDLLTRAFHHRLGEMPVRGPLVKAAAAVGVISAGGSAGPEGPMAALGASIGSTVGRAFGVTPHERRILLVAGCAAGVGAIFRCPFGGALFAAEILYSDPDFESEAMVPGFVASVIGYSTFMFFQEQFGEPLLGWAKVLRFQSPVELIPYAMLGLLCGLAAIFFSVSLHAVEKRLIERPRLPLWLIPGIGGLLTGVLACCLPQVMDGRYLFIRNALNGSLFQELPDASWWWWAAFFGAVAIAKCLGTALTVGSGASGGVLGPCVFLGGAVGAFLGAILEAVVPGGLSEPLRESLIPVGMAGVLAAGMRTPLAAIVMVAEMTGGYGLIVPLMLVCVSAYVVGRRWGLNREQLRSSADSPAHAADGIIHLLESWRVGELMDRNWELVVSPEATLGEIVARIRPGTRPVFAVVEKGQIVGLISVPDIQTIMSDEHLSDVLIASDVMTERLTVLTPDDDIYEAVNQFSRTRHDVLPVVSQRSSTNWIGMLTRTGVYEALQQRVLKTHEALQREHVELSAIAQEGQIQQLLMAVSPLTGDRVQRLMVPLDALDKTIREADVRKNFGIQVLGVELPDGSVQFPPDLDMPLTAGHRLIGVVLEE